MQRSCCLGSWPVQPVCFGYLAVWPILTLWFWGVARFGGLAKDPVGDADMHGKPRPNWFWLLPQLGEFNILVGFVVFGVKVGVSHLLVPDGVGAEASVGDKQEMGAGLLVVLFPQNLLLLVVCLLGAFIFLVPRGPVLVLVSSFVVSGSSSLT